MHILITGGAGYIGAITAKECLQAGHEVLVFDHFISHDPSKLGDTPFVKGDLLDPSSLDSALADFHPDLVMHFAAYIQMGESVQNPEKYFKNNVEGSRNLLDTMVKAGVKKLVFASSAGVYGNPLHLPIPEDDPKNPENPYGQTKWDVEQMLEEYDLKHDLKSISIRFFNAAGAGHDLGEDHHDESHIIPNIIGAQMAGKEFTLFGNDYPTPDGTCVRDYIHVLDLAEAFRLAGEKLMAGADTTAYNAGTGHGYSNLEIIKMVEKVSGKPVKVKFEPRRPGDADQLIADSTRLQKELNWSPTHSDLESIVKSAYLYHSKKWYIEFMSDKIDYKRIQNIVESAIDMKVRQIIDEEITEKLTPLRNDIDKVLKIVSDTRQEQVLTQAKVDRHDDEIKELQTFTGFATAWPGCGCWPIAPSLFSVTIPTTSVNTLLLV